MIHSSIDDNFTRVEMLHAMAREAYGKTKKSEYRKNFVNGFDLNSFSAQDHSDMEKESALVGLVMAWSVIMIESLSNHMLASAIENKLMATMAIEFPSMVTDKLKLGGNYKSELAKKIIIYSENKNTADVKDVLDNADWLSEKRNHIVHDKPFRIIKNKDGDDLTDWYRSRGNDHPTPRYEDLKTFYAKCDVVCAHIITNSPDQLEYVSTFSSLLDR